MMRPERLDRLFSRLGYGSRKEVRAWLRQGRIEVDGHVPASPAAKVDAMKVRIDGEPADHPCGLTLAYHKPLGSVCSHREQGRLIYEDFPERWRHRKPALSSVGRLDKETSGLLIVTDDGALNHALTSPRRHVPKTYEVETAEPLDASLVQIFASGELMLEGEERPCLPAGLEILDARHARLILHEGRYHQVRRMFAAVGHHVLRLHRSAIGALALTDLDLKPGAYRQIDPDHLLERIGGEPG